MSCFEVLVWTYVHSLGDRARHCHRIFLALSNLRIFPVVLALSSWARDTEALVVDVSLFSGALALWLLWSVEVYLLSDFNYFFDVVVRRLLILIIFVIAITVVHVISSVLVGAVSTQEKLASAAYCACRSTRLNFLLLLRLWCLSSAVCSCVAAHIFAAWISLTGVSNPASRLRLRVEL